uniref:FAR1 domain-containing protein n=1 Tax=Oryza nivara TaxID=4536 RepID=A0A0E0HLM6_ORYNI
MIRVNPQPSTNVAGGLDFEIGRGARPIWAGFHWAECIEGPPVRRVHVRVSKTRCTQPRSGAPPDLPWTGSIVSAVDRRQPSPPHVAGLRRGRRSVVGKRRASSVPRLPPPLTPSSSWLGPDLRWGSAATAPRLAPPPPPASPPRRYSGLRHLPLRALLREMDSSRDSEEERPQRKDNGEETENGEDGGNALSLKDVANELLGCVVHSEEEAYKLYCDYGHRIGFSVRKGKQSYFIGTKNIRTKDYYCSKEGLKYDEPVTEANFNRPDTRTNCKAMIRFRVDEKGRWTVIRFVPTHNHQLAKPGERHMLRSAKSLAVGKSGVIDPQASTESHPINGFSHMIGSDIVEPPGYTIRDCYNHVSMQGITIIEAGDSQSLVNYFKRRTNEEGMFYWDVQVDQEGRMTNFFFRDAKSRNDFDCFGDACMQGPNSETELEESWATMLNEYKLQENSWLSDLYRSRNKWCSAFNKDTFDGGINSSQWGEVSNNTFTGISDESTPLTRFALLLEKVFKGLRRNESEEDFRCSQTAPVRAIKHSTVLKQAAESYTHKIYKLFEAEFLDGCGATSCHEREKALDVFFEIRSLRSQAAKDVSKRDKKKKKSSKGPSTKKAKPTPATSSAVPELLAQTNVHQFQSAQDAQGNTTIGRPLYYQAFSSAPMQPNQIYMHPNMHTMPLCAPQQDFSAYSAMRPNSNFGGAKNV